MPLFFSCSNAQFLNSFHEMHVANVIQHHSALPETGQLQDTVILS